MANAKGGSGNARRNRWKPKEDANLLALVAQVLANGGDDDDEKVMGIEEWKAVADRVPGRSSKQCRERWRNHLDPRLTTEKWTAEEDDTIQRLRQSLGNCWKSIATHLPGRSETAIKNRHYSNLRRSERTEGRSTGSLDTRKSNRRSYRAGSSEGESEPSEESESEEDDEEWGQEEAVAPPPSPARSPRAPPIKPEAPRVSVARVPGLPYAPSPALTQSGATSCVPTPPPAWSPVNLAGILTCPCCYQPWPQSPRPSGPRAYEPAASPRWAPPPLARPLPYGPVDGLSGGMHPPSLPPRIPSYPPQQWHAGYAVPTSGGMTSYYTAAAYPPVLPSDFTAPYSPFGVIPSPGSNGPHPPQYHSWSAAAYGEGEKRGRSDPPVDASKRGRVDPSDQLFYLATSTPQ